MAFEQGYVKNELGTIVLSAACRPISFMARARGLIARPPLGADQGFWFDRCSSVHSFGMRHAIDVLFISTEGEVLRVLHRLKPWRAAWHMGSSSVLELGAGMAAQHGIQTGHSLFFYATSQSVAQGVVSSGEV